MKDEALVGKIEVVVDLERPVSSSILTTSRKMKSSISKLKTSHKMKLLVSKLKTSRKIKLSMYKLKKTSRKMMQDEAVSI